MKNLKPSHMKFLRRVLRMPSTAIATNNDFMANAQENIILFATIKKTADVFFVVS